MLSISFFASATRDSGVAVKLGGAWGGLWYLSGAILTEVMRGLVDVQLAGPGWLTGLSWFKRAFNLDPTERRKVGARMSVIPAKRRTEKKIRRTRKNFARMSVSGCYAWSREVTEESALCLTCISGELRRNLRFRVVEDQARSDMWGSDLIRLCLDVMK